MTALASQLRIFVSVFNLLNEIIVVVRFISVYILFLPAGLSQILQNILTDKNNLFPRKLNPQATFNLDLVLVSFQTTQPIFLSLIQFSSVHLFASLNYDYIDYLAGSPGSWFDSFVLKMELNSLQGVGGRETLGARLPLCNF